MVNCRILQENKELKNPKGSKLIKTHKTISTVEYCATLCQNTDKCKAATYESQTEKCRLYKRRGKLITSNDTDTIECFGSKYFCYSYIKDNI